MKTNKFKVGDKVKLVGETIYTSGFDIGGTYLLTALNIGITLTNQIQRADGLTGYCDDEHLEGIKMNKLIIDDVEINLSDETVAELKDKFGVKKEEPKEREVVYLNLDCVLSPSGTAYKEVISDKQYTHVGTCDEGEVYIYKSGWERTLYIVKSEE